MIRTVTATRYITPFREGGSLPALVEADDGDLYVMKFCGAGQGIKALIAELVAGEIARTLGLLVPDIVFIELDGKLGRSEPDEEIHDLLLASHGLNSKVLFTQLAFNQLLEPPPDNRTACCRVVRRIRDQRRPHAVNVNLLLWQNKLWLIDHGAAPISTTTGRTMDCSCTPFLLIRQHTLLSSL